MMYTKPTTKDGMTGYRYDDLDPDIQTQQVMLTPNYATGIITPRFAFELIETRPMFWEQHQGDDPNMSALFGDTVLTVPPGGIRITFPIPIKRINMYIGSDVIENDRRSSMWAYDSDGILRGGDLNMGPYGPCPDWPTLPDGADPRTTRWQYPVYHVAQNLEPPYGDGQWQPPCKYVEFDPGSETVFLGLIQAVTTEYGGS